MAQASVGKIRDTAVHVYTEGDELYADMLAAIHSARRSVKFESYIFADDEVGRRFIAALVERARAGVQVLVYIDAVGSLFSGPRAVERALREGGVAVRWFHRWNWRDPSRYNRRNHRKLLVVDGQVGFFGGFNVHRENSHSVFGPLRWRDTHVRVNGVLARTLQRVFDAFWRNQVLPYPELPVDANHQLITNHSRRGRRRLHELYARKFAEAKRSIHLTTPYFVPDAGTRRGLAKAARRGVKVQLLVPHRIDETLARVVHWAARAAYGSLMDAGVEIHEYLPRMLHAKTLVVDEDWCTVGTANLDYRSFFLNYELTLISTAPALVQRLEHDFQDDLVQSVRIQPKRWARRDRWMRFLESIGWAIRRWL
ncbi:MAG TPA: phospholipase D-like domain-containing protein [Gammaproteobacteria bacterium]|jgi:cardiolipin synthase